MEHWWRAGWAKVLTRGNERAISHWLRAHHRLSRMPRGRWPLSCDCLDEGTYGGAKYGGLNTHTAGAQHSRKRKTLMCKTLSTQTPPHLHVLLTLCVRRPFVWQLDGDDGDADSDAGGAPTAIQVTYVKCHLFCSLSASSWSHMVPFPHSLCLVLMSYPWQ